MDIVIIIVITNARSVVFVQCDGVMSLLLMLAVIIFDWLGLLMLVLKNIKINKSQLVHYLFIYLKFVVCTLSA